jgi:hypothetical protein
MKKDITDGMNPSSFVIVPEWVLMLPITATALRVYCVIRKHADAKTGECFPSRKTIAAKARCSVASVDRCVKELVENGALKVRRRKNKAGDWTSNLYTITANHTGSPQGSPQVATKGELPSASNEGRGSRKTWSQTKSISNKKQPSSDYDVQQRQDLSLGAAFFHIGATLKAVQDTAQDRTLVVDEFLRLSRKQTPQTRSPQ